jgi:transcriptional regulator with GAF, ATPase, and Fis domain
MVLSDFTADVYAIADVEAFGVVLAKPEDRAELVTRHRSGANAHIVHCERLIAPFVPSVDTPVQIAPLAGHANAAHPVFERLMRYRIECALVVPLPDGLGVLWAGKKGADGFADAQVERFQMLVSGLADALRAPEPQAERIARLKRIDAVEQMVPVIASALDIRDVFHRLSEVARAVLPHDGATIQILSDDHVHARLYALDGIPRDQVPDVFKTDYAPVFNEHFQFSVHDDLLASDAERNRPTAKAGMRSAIRLPLRFDGKIGGALELSSIATGAFSEHDVDVARRIADYVTLALSHQRMADDVKRSALLRARSEQLVALEDLLDALSGALDLRQVLDGISVVAQKVLPHDAMGVTRVLPEEGKIRVHAVSGFGAEFPESFETALPEPRLLSEPWEFRIIDDMASDPRYAASPTAKAGMQSVLGLPIRFDGNLYAGVNFYSRTKARFTQDDVLIGKRIADHLALALSHQRLADEAEQRASLAARTSNLELLDDLLTALTDREELSELIERVSAIARTVLPHDAIVMPVTLPDNLHARIYARSGMDGLPEIIDVPQAFLAPDFDHDVVGDLSVSSEPHNARTAALGFRSVLRVAIHIDGRFAAGVSFLSRAPGVYTAQDVPVARRITDRFALCLQRERVLVAAKRADEAAARAAQLEARVRSLTEELDARTGYRRVIGQSPSWTQALTQATQVAATETTVLLLGESGTGKEVIARFIHRASARSGGPFVALNCAALPEHLLEAELFGHERGAFTGATQSKPGQLEQAAGGTLFLDEVGEMALPAQAKFLRVLQEREFQRLGGTRILKTDARIVAATNRDLQQAIANGRFREDLYYRLNVFAIHLPPLRDRRDDVLPLAEAFLAEYGRTLGRPPAGISRDARLRLAEYHWPGNVRELRNILERAAILCDGGLITAEHLALTPAPSPPAVAVRAIEEQPIPAGRPGDLASMERAMIEQALQDARFNKSKAAAALGLTRAQLYVRMRRYGLE